MSLEAKNLYKQFGEKIAVNNISFTAEKGKVFGLLGTNGAGKTTSIRMILGILENEKGTILWEGKPLGRNTVKCGYLAEERGLYPKNKIMEQLIYFANLQGLTKKDAQKSIQYWAEKLEVTEYLNQVADHLSKGNQQKIQVITAIVHNPDVIFLDEPFSGLDPVNTNILKNVILELKALGKTIIISSHQMHAVEEFCDKLVILKKGSIIVDGYLKDIKRSYGRTHFSISGDNKIAELAKDIGLNLASSRGDGLYTYKITADEQAHSLLGIAIKNNIFPDRFEIHEPSLHEIFVDKVGEQK